MKKVMVGVSGGVDSAVSSSLLKKQGYEVIGATMKLFEGNEKTLLDAKNVCDKLEISHHVKDLKKEFKNNVIDTFIDYYSNGLTPNPCTACNKTIKFGAFYDFAMELGCDYLATGHYARIAFSEKYNQFVIKKPSNEKKDQTYFLYGIKKEQIPHIIFPLSEFESKDEVRKIAKEIGIPVAEKKDSQEICFIPDKDYKSFILKEESMKVKINQIKTGNICLETGEILGKHKGLMHYTVGQRKGLGLSYKVPLFVTNLDVENNKVIVGEEKELYSNILIAKDLNWQIDFNSIEKDNIFAKIRYAAKETKVKLEFSGDIVKVVFDTPQRAITKGQAVVFYDNTGILLGGGTIEEATC